ncbi:MAG: hypothetical protein HYU66_07820 [Armatimonadetes bacterium]|nr:hypothetical protein [Armatimonadota bacterium]
MPLQVGIPRAVQLVIDDVGWREGWSLADQDGPWRAGIGRLLEPDDYAAVADLGEQLGIRPSAATILCEWDRENLCRWYPTTTAQRDRWDNASLRGDWSDAAAEVFGTRSAHLELALHGVGHEHWDEHGRTRAEWFDGRGRKWDWDVLRGHLDCFRGLLDQHGLGPADGHRLPLHFVPCAFCYEWDDADPTATGALATGAGVELVSLPFQNSGLHRRSPLAAPDGGVDHGALVIDRGHSGVPWDSADSVPTEVMTQGSVLGVHWPNLLAAHPEENGRAVARWVEHLRAVGEVAGQRLAANVRECHAQWAYSTFGRVTATDDGFALDLSGLPAEVAAGVGDMPVVVDMGDYVRLGRASGEGARVVWYRRQGARAFLGVKMDGRAASLRFDPAAGPIEPVVFREGTYNVLDVRESADGLRVELEMFGRQVVAVAMGFPPVAVEVEAGELRVEGSRKHAALGVCSVTVSAHDVQGARGTILLRRPV